MGTWKSAAGEVEFLWLPRDPELAHAALVTHSSNKRQGAAINMPPAHTLPDWSRDTLHELVKGDKGFTMRDYLGDGPQSGYMVSVDPHESETFPLHDVQHHPEWIGDYFDRHQTHLDQDPSLHVGAWVNQGKVYLDLSKHVDSAEKAEALSEKHHQKAYFDLDSGVGIIPQYRQPKTGKYAGQRVGFFRNRTSLIDQVTAMKTYLRVGEPPKGGNSNNYVTGVPEVGMSVYSLDASGRPVVERDWDENEVADLHTRLVSNDPMWIVTGDVVGVGQGGEPLLANVQKIREYDPSEHFSPTDLDWWREIYR